MCQSSVWNGSGGLNTNQMVSWTRKQRTILFLLSTVSQALKSPDQIKSLINLSVKRHAPVASHGRQIRSKTTAQLDFDPSAYSSLCSSSGICWQRPEHIKVVGSACLQDCNGDTVQKTRISSVSERARKTQNKIKKQKLPRVQRSGLQFLAVCVVKAVQLLPLPVWNVQFGCVSWL